MDSSRGVGFVGIPGVYLDWHAGTQHMIYRTRHMIVVKFIISAFIGGRGSSSYASVGLILCLQTEHAAHNNIIYMKRGYLPVMMSSFIQQTQNRNKRWYLPVHFQSYNNKGFFYIYYRFFN